MTDDRSKTALALLSVAFVSLAVYSNTLNAPFLFDDFDNIVHNADVQNPGQLWLKFKMAFSPEGLSRLYFEKAYLTRPLTFASFALSHSLGGLNPYGYHLFSVLAHAAASLLVFAFVRLLLSRFFRAENLGWPLAASVLFAVHPLHTDAVAFVSNRSEPMALIFYLLAAILFLRSFGALSIASFAVSFGFKETAATFPLLVLLLDALFVAGTLRAALRERWRYHLAAWSVLAAYSALRYSYSQGVGYLFPLTFGWTRENYFYTQIYAVGQYARMLFWPSGLCLDHWVVPLQSFWERPVWLSSVALAVGAALPLGLLRRSRWFRLGLFGALWFFVTLAPTSSFFPINDALVERRAYLPSVGFFIWILSFLLWQVDERGGSQSKVFRFAFAAAIVLAGVTVERNRMYADPLRLWMEAAERYPQNFRAHFNSANILFGRDGDFDRAKSFASKSLALNPELFDAHRIMGMILANEGNFGGAVQYYSEANRLNPGDPAVLFNRGLAYRHLRKNKEALDDLRKVADHPQAAPELRDGARALIESLS